MTFGIVFGAALVPVSSTLAQENQVAPETGLSDPEDYANRIENCVFNHPLDGTGTFTGCLLRSFYWLVYYFSAWVTETSASILDFFIGYSIDTKSYSGNNNTFIERGWSIIRDIANILFIFTLLYIAIRHILQAAGSETKKLLKSLIIAALLINFSLFFTRVIIDAGNILARAFYNGIEVQNDPVTEGKSISAAIVSHINPQRILGSDFLTPVPTRGQPPGTINSGFIFFILFMTAFINFTVAITFISTFLFFAVRVIGLWFMMIFSPLALASIAVPKSEEMFGEFGWSKWLNQTVSLSFMAPIFLFFLYLLTMFLEVIETSPPTDASTAEKMVGIFIPFLVVIVVLNVAKSKAKDMSGKFGESIIKVVNKAVGYTAAVGLGALGATAFMSRMTVGAAGGALARSGMVRRGLTSENRVIRGLSKFTSTTGRIASRSSFDARNLGKNTLVGQKARTILGAAAGMAGEAATGGKVSTKLFGAEMSKGGGEGGFRKFQKDRVKANVKKQKQEAAENDIDKKELDSLRKLEKDKNAKATRANEAKTRFEETEKRLAEIASKRALNEIERDELLKAKSELDKSNIEAEQAKERFTTEDSRVDQINKMRRDDRAKWQRRYFWKPGRKQAADAVEKGEKPEDEAADLLAKMKKFVEKSEGKKDKDKEKDHEEEKPAKDSGGKSGGGKPPKNDAPSGGGSGGGHGPHASTGGGSTTSRGFGAYGEYRGQTPTANVNVDVNVKSAPGAKVESVKVTQSTPTSGPTGGVSSFSNISSGGMTTEERSQMKRMGFKRSDESEDSVGSSEPRPIGFRRPGEEDNK